MTRPIALLTDFGLQDAYVGVMKAVILARNPHATLIDLCHTVPPQNLRRGAFLLATSLPYLPPGSIVLAVVDPGVGTARRALAVEVGPWTYVGPDNGLLAWSLHFLARDGQVAIDASGGKLRLPSGARAVELAEPRFWRPEVSGTFHGRDLFAPVAAELSLGCLLDELGPPADQLVDLPWPEPQRADDGVVIGEVVTADGYGNLITNLRPGDLPPEPAFELAEHVVCGLSPNFQSADLLVALVGSFGFIEFAAPSRNASELIGSGLGITVRVLPASSA